MQRCLFCWRPVDISPVDWKLEEYDEPEVILEEAIQAQRKLLEGYGGLLGRINRKKFEEAQNPNQVAISLAGEPTIYPVLGDFIGLCTRKGMSTFLVSNGMLPDAIASLNHLPTQLYVSLVAPDEETHKKVNIPMLSDSWDRLNKTLELMSGLDTRRTIRITAIKGMNDHSPEKYAKLIEKSNADFVEVKSYMFVGYSRKRLSYDNMLTQGEIRDFGTKIANELGYKVVDESPVSRVILLSSDSINQKI
jgi:tRNA wybutosine-synthesizing protein 1